MKYKSIKEKLDIICTKCKRNLPNKDFFTKDGCIWCSIEFYYKNKNSKKHNCKNCKGLCKNK